MAAVTLKKDRLRNVFLTLWSSAAVLAALLHLVLGEWTARGTYWGYSPGWQREIAFFDLAMAGVVVYVIKKGSSEAKRVTCLILLLLCFVLGTNHAVEFFRGGPDMDYLHIAGMTANYFEILIGATFLFFSSER